MQNTPFEIKKEKQSETFPDWLQRSGAPHDILPVPLPVNDVIERDWFSTGIKVNLLIKLICKIHRPYVMQQLDNKGEDGGQISRQPKKAQL